MFCRLLQAAGRCKARVAVGQANNCSWSVGAGGGGSPVKTVSTSCLNSRGLAAACGNATVVPRIGCSYAAAEEVLHLAFQT